MHQQDSPRFSLLIFARNLIDVCLALVHLAEVNGLWSLLKLVRSLFGTVFFVLPPVSEGSCLLWMRNFNDRSCWLFEYWPFDYLRLGRLKARFVEILYLLVIELHDILPQMGKIFQYFLAIVYWSSCSPQLIVWLRPWRMIYNICWRSLFSACFGI